MGKIVTSLYELCESLDRACDVFRQPIVRDTPEGHQVFMRTEEALTPQLSALSHKYIRSYWRDKGWATSAFKSKKTFVSFELRPLSPKRSRGSRRSPGQKPSGQ